MASFDVAEREVDVPVQQFLFHRLSKRLLKKGTQTLLNHPFDVGRVCGRGEKSGPNPNTLAIEVWTFRDGLSQFQELIHQEWGKR